KLPPARTAGAAIACLALGIVLVTGVLEIRRIECCWPDVRAGRMPQDSSELKGALAAAVAEARRLAERGMTVALLPRDVEFERLQDAVRSGSRTPGVALRFYAPRLAPHDPDVFDYCPTSCERGDTLFSVEPVAPAQGDAKLAVWRAAALRAAVALGVTLILLLVAAPAGAWRWLVVL